MRGSWRMASPPQEAHRLSRRDSSPRSGRNSSRRPRLLRACATEPSVTKSSTCKGVLTSPNPSRGATELLRGVAVSNAAAGTVFSSSPDSARSFENSGLSEEEKRALLRCESGACFPHDDLAWLARDEANPLTVVIDSACYFSFPSFDAWESEHQEEERSYDGAS
ncbi:hypothetical protein BX600DRAFT_299009 [Xylariales sp. PMI_506]|nr:hypothetical protein BX600DRAFT_299009 [Xylariales sp. PMI_506]